MSGKSDAFPGRDRKGKLRTHGTSVAGVIAMVKDNKKCGVGIAHNSRITGVRLGISMTLK